MTEKAATRDAYGAALQELGGKYEEIVVLDADLSASTRTCKFAEKYPGRFFQMGISEQDMICTAAGLASAGKLPFASSFVIFASRAWEQIRNMVCRSRLAVNLCLTHAGISVGEDGSSAQALEDIAIMRALPHMRIFVPADDIETTQIIYHLATHRTGPAYVRLGRSKVPRVNAEKYRFRAARATKLRDGGDATIIACGLMVSVTLEAAEMLAGDGVEVTVLNMSSIKPIDVDSIVEASRATGRIVTVEEHSIIGGLGGAVAEVLAEHAPCPMRRIGMRDTFGESGAPGALLEKYGLSKENIAGAVRSLL